MVMMILKLWLELEPLVSGAISFVILPPYTNKSLHRHRSTPPTVHPGIEVLEQISQVDYVIVPVGGAG